MKIDILTLFPHMFEAPLGESIIGRAREKEILNIQVYNIRDYAENKHKRVDDYPYGGGAGMVMQPEPIFNALESIGVEKARILYMSPKGKTFHQEMAIALSKEEHLVFLCGHYEGIDQRVLDYWVTDEISIGDYVLTGGELPAMVVIDAVARMIPGVLSQSESFMDESFYSGLLEYPQYTRPSEYRGLKVPETLLSGNHKNIEAWRKTEALKLTIRNRPDLLEKYIQNPGLPEKEKQMIRKLMKEILEK
ncbi:tRNA (guanosine(37)-N1)-methyltransferase TrmD [Geosporobacter ferrireducens]|uniref:tRNA (guanine-N(1)-)-methyltransferase n=1 Tax=Geosporobacter ferrireducens TaxID=1424294 RepID=A0A1D8GBX2_9FIRM|nr:tRNA (guanosine(37)-N1)-methyltransferase TrmD [Geosporobacter ferrireducens]AOT68383.1 tRNA (guanosine(37)-N1)-methyltransferase TrmD [Geosporobacter ferrireducens]MTI53831.1 tRNA (guanosine(37)-N1)-methyltransferase TrmD [Geosporobacter ferrireducens]